MAKTTTYETFWDESFYDMMCLRPVGSRDYNDTVHVNTQAEADILKGKLESGELTWEQVLAMRDSKTMW